MATDLDPIVGKWYTDLDADAEFEVLAVDEDTGLVEVQLYDGRTQEIDLDDWYKMELSVADPEDEWSDDETVATADDEDGDNEWADNWGEGVDEYTEEY